MMCGIVGAVRLEANVVSFLVNGLRCMEYRGYDSSGIAVLAQNKIVRVRRVGRVSELENAVQEIDLVSTIGIGHTRWATHGQVTEPNAHPHVSQQNIVVVHNGIIENYSEEKKHLVALGYEFESQTDTEVIAHCIHYAYQQSNTLFEAVQTTISRFKGAYAFGVLCLDEPNTIVLARMGCPLLIGLAQNDNFFASDVSALVSHTRDIIYLEDGDIAQISIHGVDKLIDRSGRAVKRTVKKSEISLTSLELGPYNHFMQKEIYEQPKAIVDTAELVFSDGFVPSLFGQEAKKIFNATTKITILACGSSYYTGLVAKYWLEGIAKIQTDVEVASEYRYRGVIADSSQLIVAISQSGETLDTIEALKQAKSLGHNKALAICNVMESSLVRESDLVFYTRAGAEICVASTKAFTTQLVALYALTITLAVLKGSVDKTKAQKYLEDLRHLSGNIQSALNLESQIIEWANVLTPKNNALFLGRGIHYPVALEGALKLKEITYIHAEAYPAGELKHGPLALIDKNMPVIVIAPNDALRDKLKNNMQEVVARSGEVFVFTDTDSDYAMPTGVRVIRLPRHIRGVLSAIVYTIPMQLLAYHIALVKGTDIDKPRNLAKSVTVE